MKARMKRISNLSDISNNGRDNNTIKPTTNKHTHTPRDVYKWEKIDGKLIGFLSRRKKMPMRKKHREKNWFSSFIWFVEYSSTHTSYHKKQSTTHHYQPPLLARKKKLLFGLVLQTRRPPSQSLRSRSILFQYEREWERESETLWKTFYLVNVIDYIEEIILIIWISQFFDELCDFFSPLILSRPQIPKNNWMDWWCFRLMETLSRYSQWCWCLFDCEFSIRIILSLLNLYQTGNTNYFDDWFENVDFFFITMELWSWK